MTLPVQYVLRHPYFISTRLLPAIKVADTTIHMHAHSIDTEEPDDPRVVWEYTIEGPDIDWVGLELTTPYHGPDTIAGQLPTAMDTLLYYLAAISDSQPDDDEPDRLEQWARANHEALTAVIAEIDADDGRPNAAEQSMPASTAWRSVTNDPEQTPYGRWCAGQATQHADSMATLSPRDATAPGLAVRDQTWHENALAFYTMLASLGEPTLPDAPTCVVAGPDALFAWLRGPAPHDEQATSMGEHVGVRDIGLRVSKVPDLVEQAQQAGMFGIPGHTIHVHRLFDEQDESSRAAHLLTVTTPDGTHLATTPIATDHLRNRRGSQAAVTLLNDFAARVNTTLASSRPMWTTPAGRGRAFPPMLAAAGEQTTTVGRPPAPPNTPRHTR